MHLFVNGQRFMVTDLQTLRAHWAAIRDRQWNELEIGEDEDPGEGGDFFGLIALINRKRSFLVYFRYAGDAGFSSRDPNYKGSPTATLGFAISGQADEYPVAWTVPTTAALHALEYALLHQARAPWITWYEDG